MFHEFNGTLCYLMVPFPALYRDAKHVCELHNAKVYEPKDEPLHLAKKEFIFQKSNMITYWIGLERKIYDYTIMAG
jgi:hypothetical protein